MADEDDAATVVDIPAADVTGAGAPASAPQSGPGTLSPADEGPSPKSRRMARVWWAYGLIALWAALAVADLMFFRSGGSRPAAAGRAAATSSAPATATAGATASPGTTPAMAPGAIPAVIPAEAAHVLEPVSASAFGPAGPASGDNPGLAPNAIDVSMATAWSSDWYRTAEFGHLQAGTGLLIDMGRKVVIKSATLTLGGSSGADLELLTGNAPHQTAMSIRASAADVGGIVSLTLHQPRPARYLLVWFTLLPRDSAGTYQVTVYNIAIKGS